MGTNYYWHANPCAHCGRSDEPKHIGKSSAGWVFALRVYPSEGIRDLGDWLALFDKPGEIKDEYGRHITAPDLLNVILVRFCTGSPLNAEWLTENCARLGPLGLAVPRDSPLGFGTYSLNEREFS